MGRTRVTHSMHKKQYARGLWGVTLLFVLEEVKVESLLLEHGAVGKYGEEGKQKGVYVGFLDIKNSLNFVQSATVSNWRKDFNQGVMWFTCKKDLVQCSLKE